MLRLNILPDCELADTHGRERPFEEWLPDLDVILVTRTREPCIRGIGSPREIERLAIQFGLNVALSPYRIARAPPRQKHADRRTAAAEQFARTAGERKTLAQMGQTDWAEDAGSR